MSETLLVKKAERCFLLTSDFFKETVSNFPILMSSETADACEIISAVNVKRRVCLLQSFTGCFTRSGCCEALRGDDEFRVSGRRRRVTQLRFQLDSLSDDADMKLRTLMIF